MIDQLASEQLDSILEHIWDKGDLYNLCLVSKSLHAHALPFLFSRHPVVIQAPDVDSTHEFRGGLLANLARQPSNLLQKARDVQIQPIRGLESDLYCSHPVRDSNGSPDGEGDSGGDNNFGDDDNPDEENELVAELKAKLALQKQIEYENRDQPSRKRAAYLLPVLQAFRDGYLKSFSWEIGTCIPREIMGKDGWLTCYQTAIETLRLITGCSCDLTLAPYRNLKSLTWVGLYTRAEIGEAQRAIYQNANHLEHLHLDFNNLHTYGWNDRIAQVTADEVLGLSHPPDAPRIPFIRSLSLSYVRLGNPNNLALGLSWGTLTSLTIRGCPGARDLLETLAEPPHSANLRLKTFDLCIDGVDANSTEASVLIKFLESFIGLENLYLHVEAILYSYDSIWEAVTRHGATLRRFAYQISRWHDNIAYEWSEDMGTLGISEEGALERVKKDNALARLDVECLGLAGHPNVLNSVFLPLAKKSTIKLLHLRQPDSSITSDCQARTVTNQSVHGDVAQQRQQPDSENAPSVSFVDDNMTRLVDWVFGPEGMQSVDLLAFGDFSCGGRYSKSSFMIRRVNEASQTGGRPWEFYDRTSCVERVPQLESLLKQHSGFLDAAPTEPLLPCYIG